MYFNNTLERLDVFLDEEVEFQVSPNSGLSNNQAQALSGSIPAF